MALEVPARQNDFPNDPDLRQKILARWNDSSPRGQFLGAYLREALCVSENYVDPRVEPPVGAAVPVPWNGFPKLISRWYDDGISDAAKSAAERAADVPTPMLYWFDSDDPRSLNSAPAHQLPFFIARLAGDGKTPAFPGAPYAETPRSINSDGTLGPPVPHFRRQQDEYLEWHAVKDAGGRLKKLVFSAEAPDYWSALAATTKEARSDRLVELYRQLVDDRVKPEDLFYQTDLAIPYRKANGDKGWMVRRARDQYNPLNNWTTTAGVVHLTHSANTLGAEVRLAADASALWQSDRDAKGPKVGPEIRRIACGGYGGINRSSDPLIGKGVGDAIVGGSRITLTDPIGLYIADVAIDGLTGPKGEAVGRSALRIIRGDANPKEPRILRFEIELSAGTKFGLDECLIDARKLERGGQIARKVSMQLYAHVYPASTNPDTMPNACNGTPCRHPAKPDVFIVGGLDQTGTPRCPDATSKSWLMQTPYDGTLPPGPAEPAGLPLGVEALSAEIEPASGPPPPFIARSRAGYQG